jgi:DNA-directed RNA polymerase specialized sigma subunit
MREDDVLRWLERFKKIDELMRINVSEREKAIAYATRCTSSIDGMPRGGSGKADRVADGAVRKAALEEEFKELEKERQGKLEVLKQLPPDEYGVLYRIYVRRITRWETACEMHFSEVSVWRIKKRATSMLAKLLSEQKAG